MLHIKSWYAVFFRIIVSKLRYNTRICNKSILCAFIRYLIINVLLVILRIYYNISYCCSLRLNVICTSFPEYNYVSLGLPVNPAISLDNLWNSHCMSSSEKYRCLTAWAAVIRLWGSNMSIFLIKSNPCSLRSGIIAPRGLGCLYGKAVQLSDTFSGHACCDGVPKTLKWRNEKYIA